MVWETPFLQGRGGDFKMICLGERVDQNIIKQVGSCAFNTLVKSEGNVDKILHYCLMN